MDRIKVACAGAGVIGSSFAVSFAMNDMDVAIYEIEAGVENARKAVGDVIESLKGFGVLDDKKAAAIWDQIEITTNPEKAFKNIKLVQENGPENVKIKRQMLSVIEEYAPEDTPYASSTSSLSIADIAANAIHPERCMGAHPFNPPHLIPLVEIAMSKKTEQEYVDKAVAIYRSVGKEPVVMNIEKPGFIANRFSHAVLREQIALVMEGVCSVEDTDKALVYGPGLRWGAVGQGMIAELASPFGAEAFTKKFTPVNEHIFSDLSNLTKVPEGWAEKCGQGVEEEKANLADFIGHNAKDIAGFRDKVLIELLRVHNKI